MNAPKKSGWNCIRVILMFGIFIAQTGSIYCTYDLFRKGSVTGGNTCACLAGLLSITFLVGATSDLSIRNLTKFVLAASSLVPRFHLKRRADRGDGEGHGTMQRERNAQTVARQPRSRTYPPSATHTQATAKEPDGRQDSNLRDQPDRLKIEGNKPPSTTDGQQEAA